MRIFTALRSAAKIHGDAFEEVEDAPNLQEVRQRAESP